LRDEQQRLRDEQEHLRRERAQAPDGNAHNGSSEGKEQRKPEKQKPEVGGGEKQDLEKKPDPREEEQREWRKQPLRTRVRTYVHEHRKGVLLGAVGLIAATFLIVLLLLYLRSYESTDDAQVDGHLNSISPRISGTVVHVYVENNQSVTAGQPVAELDPRDYEVALAQARATAVQAEAQLRAENPNLPIIQTTNQTTISTSGADVVAAQAGVVAAQQEFQARLANVSQAEANNAKAQMDVRRYAPLVQREEISHEQYDTVVANAKSQAAAVDAAQAAASAAQKAVDQSRAQLLQAQSRQQEANQNAPRSVQIRRAQLATREAALLAARAQVEQAALNLSYTKIYAPVSGVVNEKTVEVGQHIQAGEQLLVISQLDDIWVTANFKETQLRKMRANQPVDISVDAYGIKYHGYVEGMPGATGSVMSLLPPENATGNFVKVVQRMPVRIRLDQGENSDHRLRPGMSVVPKVWLK
jgi:membrane fusion protein (multidrug efflux system)